MMEMPQAQAPPQCSSEPYMARQLRQGDYEGFSGAALVPYKKVNEEIQILLGSEKPWNSFKSSYDPEALNVLGGKRIFRSERNPIQTASRTFQEALLDGMNAPSAEELAEQTSKSFVFWFPTGKYALVFFEVDSDLFNDLPVKFAEAKKAAGPREEFTITKDGVKKWTKHYEGVAWVSTSELVPEAKRECTNLLENMLKCKEFVEFLQGNVDPESFPAPQQRSNGAPKGKSKGGGKDGGYGGKSFKAAKGGGKSQGYGGGCGGGGKGDKPKGGFVKGFHVVPASPSMDQINEMQLQMYGEQLYVLVQPLAPNQFIAQKITGMLLELPMNELMLNITNPVELQKRVTEATALLKADGIV
eukprot:TRINITY_DN62770_c0_g1_i1.p1 TRINITY_DN62770_c0_g1~~TRINITY_DN62770_c0_g1_i1.p1  ORF type:complete len:404 (-),score=95.05 TRINITY_DN62770_c0_g1_i1:155-1228(-)